MRWALLASVLLATTGPAALVAQSEPFIVHDTKPVITHGPWLVDPTESAITVVWMTDTPSHSAVRYGVGDSLDQQAESPVHGLLPVTLLHSVRLTGLTPGKRYHYRAISTRVVKLKAYWPEKGLSIETPIFSFTTFDRHAPTVAFSLITDTHEDVARINSEMKAIDWNTTDFLVHLGDAFDWVDNEDQLFAKWLDPVGRGLAHAKPLLFARGNHEYRGAFARALFDYVPVASGEFYAARDIGPLHLLVLDSGEDKPDSTNVYSRLNRSEPYLQRELQWAADQATSDPRFGAAPFRVVLMHQPLWGSMPEGAAKFRRFANAAKIDLVIAGHDHRFSRVNAGTGGAGYTTLVLGQDQVARVAATASAIRVVVRSTKGELVDSFVVSRR